MSDTIVWISGATEGTRPRPRPHRPVCGRPHHQPVPPPAPAVRDGAVRPHATGDLRSRAAELRARARSILRTARDLPAQRVLPGTHRLRLRSRRGRIRERHTGQRRGASDPRRDVPARGRARVRIRPGADVVRGGAPSLSGQRELLRGEGRRRDVDSRRQARTRRAGARHVGGGCSSGFRRHADHALRRLAEATTTIRSRARWRDSSRLARAC